jgi:hypothetical protein
MRISPSNLEMMIYLEMQRRGIIDQYLRNQIIIFYPTTSEILNKEAFTETKAKNCLTFTLPDFMSNTKCYAYYIDGPPHLTPHNSHRDAHINYQLEKYNIQYKRWSYKRPAKTLMNRIVDEMEALRLG